MTAAEGAQKRNQETYAIVAGTVFRDPGFALRGAQVVLVPAPDAPAARGSRKMKATADARGEFVFRVPPGPMRYIVTASAKGMKTEEKPVTVQDGERVDVTFMLVEESNK